MERTKTPLHLVSIHSRRGNVRWLALAIQSHLAPMLGKDNSYNFSQFLCNYGVSTLNLTFCQAEEWDAVGCNI